MRFLLPCTGILTVVIGWGLLTHKLLIPPTLLPSPFATGEALTRATLSGQLLQDSSATLTRWGLGVTLGAMSGVIFGILLGVSRSTSLLVFPIVEFAPSIPVVALFPLLLLLFGIGDESKIAIAFVPSFLLIAIATQHGITQQPPERAAILAIFGASRLQRIRWVTIPQMMPQTFLALRLASSIALIATVVSEMFLGTQHGIGQRIYDAYLMNTAASLYAHVIVIGVLGVTVNVFIAFIGSRLQVEEAAHAVV